MKHCAAAASPFSPWSGQTVGHPRRWSADHVRARQSRQGGGAARDVVRSRRGDVGEAMQWIYRLTAAIILFWLLFAQIQMITNFMKVPDHMELALYQQRFIDGPDGVFAHEPTTGRVLDGVVDTSRFNDRTLTNAYVQDAGTFGARLTLYLNTTTLEQQQPFMSATNAPDVVEKYLPLAEAGLTGPGGGLYERHVYPVMMQFPNEPLRPGWLEIEAVKRT